MGDAVIVDGAPRVLRLRGRRCELEQLEVEVARLEHHLPCAAAVEARQGVGGGVARLPGAVEDLLEAELRVERDQPVGIGRRDRDVVDPGDHENAFWSSAWLMPAVMPPSTLIA